MVYVREFSDADETTCADIFARAWTFAFPDHAREIDADTFVRETDGELVLIAELDRRVAGFAALYERESFLHHLYIDPAMHKRGVGRALVQACIDRSAKPLTLKCQASNSGARRFYERLGFTEHEEGRDEYGTWILLRAP